MSSSKKILAGFLGGFGLTIVNIVVAFAQFRLLFHFLSQEQAGVWLLFLSIGGYVVLFDLGIGPTLGREISFSAGQLQLNEDHRVGQIRTLIRTGTGLTTALAVLVLLLGVSAGWVYLRATVPPQLARPAHVAWNIYVFSAAINLVGQGWFAGIYGLGEVFKEKLLRSAGQICGILLLSIALWFRLGLEGLAIASVLQALLTIMLAKRTLRLDEHELLTLGHLDPAIIRRLLGPSLKYAGTLLGGILILQTDNLVIASRLGTAMIPNYQALSKIVTTLMALSTMLIVSTTPFLSQAYAQGNIDEIKRLLRRNLKLSLSIMVILGSILACFADQIVGVWLGPGHFVGFAVVWVLLLVMLLETHHTSMATATMATGKIVFLVPALIAGGLNIVFSVFLAGKYGLLGVALGTLCAQAVTNNWYVPWYTMRQFHLGFADHFRSVLAPTLGLLALTLGVGYSVRNLVPAELASVSILAGSISTTSVGLVVVLWLVLSKNERAYVFSHVRRILLRRPD